VQVRATIRLTRLSLLRASQSFFSEAHGRIELAGPVSASVPEGAEPCDLVASDLSVTVLAARAACPVNATPGDACDQSIALSQRALRWLRSGDARVNLSHLNPEKGRHAPGSLRSPAPRRNVMRERLDRKRASSHAPYSDTKTPKWSSNTFLGHTVRYHGPEISRFRAFSHTACNPLFTSRNTTQAKTGTGLWNANATT